MLSRDKKIYNIKHSAKRILAVMLAALFVVSLTGCQPSYFTSKESSNLTKAMTTAVHEWFKQNYPDAKDITYNLHTEYINEDGDIDIFGYVLTDVMEGEYTLNGTKYEYVFVGSTKTMYLSTYIEDAKEYVKSRYRTGLGFTEDDIMAENDVTIGHELSYKGYYDLDRKGTLEDMDIVDSYYNMYNVLPADLKEDEVEEYIDTHINDGLVKMNRYSITVKDNISVSDIDLEFLRDNQEFDEIDIETPDVTYEIFKDYRTIDNQDKKVICIKTIGYVENATISDASPGNASTGSASYSGAAPHSSVANYSGNGKAGSTKEHIYEYDMESLMLSASYDIEDR